MRVPHSIVLLASFMALAAFVVSPVVAQLPPDAVDLSKVKIPETQKSAELCPVNLVPSAADGESWEYQGTTYRGSEPGAKDAFLADPEKFVEAAEKERWINNFMLAMSTIWCPITDEVTPGGRKQTEALGFKWESCCSFCDEEMSGDNFEEALERLRARAEQSYELTGGVYVEGASSPVEGAIKDTF